MHFFYVFFFISSIFFVQEAQGQVEFCDWKLEGGDTLTIGDISFIDTQKKFMEVNSQTETPIELVCIFDQPVSLKNKLIGFDYHIRSSLDYDYTVSLEDVTGDIRYISQKIRQLYDIYEEKPINIVLDPADFKQIGTNKITGTDTGIDFVKTFKLELNQNSFSSISISDLNIITQKEFPNFEVDENLPIQSTIPAFLGLILISFPIGFVLLNKANFLKEENFFVKIPWFVGF